MTANFLLAAAAAMAQHVHPPPAEKPVALLAGMGKHTHAIGTANPRAQKFFDQGLNLLYGFNRYEALRSFRKAAGLDPKALMPRWGIAAALGPHLNMDLDGDVNLKDACEAVAAARGLRDGAPEVERAYFDAVALRCPEDRPEKYQAAMRALSAENPDDLDAAALYSESLMMGSRWRWWGADGKPAEGVEEAVRVIEGVLRRNPEHPGANHYYIHAVEMSPTPERAVPSAQRLMGIVPGAGHLVHMPGHIWMLLGEYDAAAAANERAAEVDRQYMKATGVTMSAYAGYYIHNLHFVAVGRSMQGRALDSLKAAEALSDATTPYVKDMAAMIDAFVMWPAFAALRAGQWEKALAIPKPDERLLASAAIWHYARALAFHGQGRKAEAEKAREAFEAARAKVPSSWVWLLNKAPDILAVASAVLEARLAGDEASIEHWRRAVRLQDGLAYDEPPGWYYPIRESLGGALLRAGRSAEAEQVFRKGVRLSPKNGRMLFGLMESLKAQRKAGAAKMVEREFDAAWKRADVKLLVGDL